MNIAYIVDAVRTAGGRRNGKLASWHPVDMGAEVINALLDRTGIDPNIIDDAIFGCVTQAGEQTFAFARNIVLASKLPIHIPGVTIDRQCGSSQQAVQFAAQAILSGMQDVVIAGGVESMTRTPMLSNASLHAKAGLPADPLSPRIKARFAVDEFSQFTGAEMMAKKYGFKREQLDQFALLSHQRAIQATETGAFENEIIALQIDDEMHRVDEGIRFDANLESISAVKPLVENGVVTAANASQICDGASAVLIVSERALKAYGLTPKARLVHMSVSAGDPVIMLEEPIFATQKALKKRDLKLLILICMKSMKLLHLCLWHGYKL
ncbi:acetyl-CoA C-acyltransferase [uncultured Acinetobacter sp.]|uniref:acetyl-CoA C-acyltransferase n=1 Tax=uncultured Acinetobacter sp. TaxID=165433 RepID=UPI002587CECB|nr:acetyl-CoA C-acyltransferase [uncultured Acinetobacter sp.]